MWDILFKKRLPKIAQKTFAASLTRCD